MEFRNLNTFVMVAELSNFTKAAEQLGYSQSTVSFQIRQLEEELGVSLLDRIGRNVTLTEKGMQVLDYAHRMIQLRDEMEHELKKEKLVSGHIRVAMAESLSSYFLRNRFVEFREQYPNISLEIVSGGADEMLKWMEHGEVDIVLTLDTHIYNSEYVVVEEKRVGTHFVAGMNCVFAEKYYGRKLQMEEIIDEPFMLTEKGMSYRSILERRLAGKYKEIHPVLESGDALLLRGLSEQGAGITFLPDFVTEKAVEEGKLFFLDLDSEPIELWRQLIHHKNKWVSPAIQAVIEFLKRADTR